MLLFYHISTFLGCLFLCGVALDGGGENNTLLTSAGGCCLTVRRPMAQVKNSAPCYAVRVRGLLGGHSGGEIHKEKGNANKLMARILYETMRKGFSFALCELNGGLKDNAIPRECDAILACEQDADKLEAQIRISAGAIWKELEFSDNKFAVEFEKVEASPVCFDAESTKAAVQMLFLFPNGFMARSMAIEGLTMTSLNVGIVSTDADGLQVVLSLRSMLKSAIDNLANQILLLAELYGATVSRSADYPGWNFSEKSPMRDVMAESVKEIYNEKLNVTAAHGGCECGVFSGLHPDMDIITLGPVARYIHTPDEELDLSSFDRTYLLLTNVVKRCK